jgi:hypothetical protein
MRRIILKIAIVMSIILGHYYNSKSVAQEHTHTLNIQVSNVRPEERPMVIKV